MPRRRRGRGEDAQPSARLFRVDGSGRAEVRTPHEAVLDMGVSAAASAAYDILTDDDVPPVEAWKLALGAERNGQNAEAFARHFVKLRRTLREP